MEPISLAIAIVTASRDVYSTVKFIQKVTRSTKHIRSEQSDLSTQFDLQILRLNEFSRILGAENGEGLDLNYLKSIPEPYLRIVQDHFAKLQKILGEYTREATKFGQSRTQSQNLNTAETETLRGHADAPNVNPSANEAIATEKRVNQGPGHKRWSLSLFGFGSGNPKPKTSSTSLSLKSLPEGVHWMFLKDNLEGTLAEFTKWNDNLEDMLGILLRGFGITEDKALQDRLRLQLGQSMNIFEGHIALANLSLPSKCSSSMAQVVDESLLSWQEAEAIMERPRILIEYKKSGAASIDDSEVSKTSITRETYAPQLAQLLRAAGSHGFRTLRLNAYAWNLHQEKCAFLFDYPENAGSKQPQSLHDLIMNPEREPSFKLDLKQRFYVAHTIAQSIGSFHSDGWLHKSIRAHAIKFFSNRDEDGMDFTRPYLTDFEMSRPVTATTRLLPHAVDVEHDVYRHPQRYGLPRLSFSKIHDIYSLGVVLLEIGLWQTAREMHDDLVEGYYGGVQPTEGVPGNLIREAFLREAKTRLAHRMGASYEEAVVTCLSGDLGDRLLDADFAGEFQRRVVEKVDIRRLAG
ncbi:hypothetical protein B0T10DRAFT_545974 [Thelonectria olida]|uniref:Protein kinase domain-containing protein n=1 Tax=Thelonectria olida TaxID=1576542 RepID=A0A9P8WBD7_9HYPO|nr:hypothetical protein B0T10DRAFT_545974 [Thelonectria olida]